MSEAWLTCNEYMKDVHVEVEKPRLSANLIKGERARTIITFGVTRWYHELAEQGVTVNLTPEQARELGNTLIALYLDAQQEAGMSV